MAIAATIHSPERAQNMVARMGEREESLTVWIRAAQADGRLKQVAPEFAAQQIHGLLKSFAFWPQISMGQTGLSPEMQHTVVESALDMFWRAMSAEPSCKNDNVRHFIAVRSL